MSEALQKVAGDKLRSILSAMTSNRVTGVLTGFLITAIIQSSSATTVMIVSFVNAGLLSLVESIGVIMGANIGTTVTAWLISLLGFKIKISALALPLIGVGFPLVFSKNTNRKAWGETIIGFAIVFMGLEFLKSSVPDIKNSPEILEFLSNYTDLGFLSTLMFLAIGTILTIVIQSSSATMALTLVMCHNGWISFEMAAAMVLGENIGTTITANLAAMVANTAARQAARAHLIFNMVGVTWMLLIFHYFLDGIDWFIQSTEGASPYETSAAVPIALSIFHTVFNILNVLLLVGFANLIVRIAQKMVKVKEEDDTVFRLQYINTGMLSTSELSILQARKEIAIYGTRTGKMFGYVQQLSKTTNDKEFEKLLKKVEKYEEIFDRMEVEIASYLTKVSEGELSISGSRRIQAMMKIIDNIESVGDACYNISKTLKRKKQQKIWFTQDIRNNLDEMFNLVEQSISVMNDNLDDDYQSTDLEKANNVETQINELRTKLAKKNDEAIKTEEYPYQTGVAYHDIFYLCETLGDNVINISEAINDTEFE